MASVYLACFPKYVWKHRTGETNISLLATVSSPKIGMGRDGGICVVFLQADLVSATLWGSVLWPQVGVGRCSPDKLRIFRVVLFHF